MSQSNLNCQSSIEDAILLEKQICFPLYSAANAVIRAYRPLLEKLDLTYSQYLVMLVLWQHDGIALKAIGEQLHIDSGALTPVLKRMEGMGLLKRTRNPDNERTLDIRLTEAGLAMRTQALEVNRRAGASCGLDLPKVMQLREDLVELRNHLTKNAK